ncbi:MAG TPA: hypothetical protein VLX32_14050 [Candidatus Acidoferrum sp.]|nr:hypothetical protein [Candidatus Acidoferrum sp.]
MDSTSSAAATGRATPVGFRRAWRALRQLFHEMIGALFGILALIWIQNSLRAWAKDVPRWVVGLALGIAGLLAVFAWTSFRKARQL